MYLISMTTTFDGSNGSMLASHVLSFSLIRGAKHKHETRSISGGVNPPAFDGFELMLRPWLAACIT